MTQTLAEWEANERKAFEAWASKEWTNSYPPQHAWTGWLERAKAVFNKSEDDRINKMITTEVANLKLSFEGREDFAKYVRALALRALSESMDQTIIKEQRYLQGKASAYETVANLIDNSNLDLKK